MRKKTAI